MIQLGKALGILVRQRVNEEVMHMDVCAFGAPSECHDLVSRCETQRARLARRHARAVAQMPVRVLVRRAKKLGYSDKIAQRAFFRVFKRNCPFI